jgi:hypothetical protein
MALGYCTTTAVGYGYIQPYQSGTGYRNLALCDSGGNVGIGTTNPSLGLLHVQGGDVYASANVYGDTGNARWRLQPQYNASAPYNDYFRITNNWDPIKGTFDSSSYAACGINLNSYQGGSQIEFLTSSTNNAVPTEKVRIVAGAFNGRTDMYGDSLEIGAGRSSDGGVNIDFHTADSTYSDYAFRILRASGANGAAEINHRGTGDLVYKSQEAGAQIWYTTNTERMRLAAGGNVGIGTNNPGSTLQIQCGDAYDGGITLSSAASGASPATDYMIQRGPSSSLLLTNSSNCMIFHTTNDTVSTTGPVGFLWMSSSSRLAMFYDTRNSRLGIGTTNPTSNLQVNGSLSKTSGTFDIPHPFLTEPKRLVHSFVEAPRCDLIYRGSVKLENGMAIVNIDSDCTSNASHAMTQGTFVSLCTNPVYYLQNDGSFDRIKGAISGNTLTIICENNTSSDLIHWMVVAERKDVLIKQWDRTDPNGFLIPEY